MFLPDGHVLVEGVHVGSFVVVGPSEEMREELDHRRMQFGDVGYVFEEEVVDTVVSQDVLIKLGHHFLQLIMATYLFEDCRHPYHCRYYFIFFKGKQHSKLPQQSHSKKRQEYFLYQQKMPYHNSFFHQQTPITSQQIIKPLSARMITGDLPCLLALGSGGEQIEMTARSIWRQGEIDDYN